MSSSPFPYATLANIQSSSWELMLDSTAGGGPGSGIGKVTQALADIEQCLAIIFTTIPGEDPYRPTFGCDLSGFLDQPLTVAAPALVAAVTAAIQAWEPRISVVSVVAKPNPSVVGQLFVTITWTPNLGTSSGTSSVAIGSKHTTTILVGGN